MKACREKTMEKLKRIFLRVSKISMIVFGIAIVVMLGIFAVDEEGTVPQIAGLVLILDAFLVIACIAIACVLSLIEDIRTKKWRCLREYVLECIVGTAFLVALDYMIYGEFQWLENVLTTFAIICGTNAVEYIFRKRLINEKEYPYICDNTVDTNICGNV